MADRLHVSVSMHEGVSVIGGVQTHAPRSDGSICPTTQQDRVAVSGCMLGAERWVQKSELNASSSVLRFGGGRYFF